MRAGRIREALPFILEVHLPEKIGQTELARASLCYNFERAVSEGDALNHSIGQTISARLELGSERLLTSLRSPEKCSGPLGTTTSY